MSKTGPPAVIYRPARRRGPDGTFVDPDWEDSRHYLVYNEGELKLAYSRLYFQSAKEVVEDLLGPEDDEGEREPGWDGGLDLAVWYDGRLCAVTHTCDGAHVSEDIVFESTECAGLFGPSNPGDPGHEEWLEHMRGVTAGTRDRRDWKGPPDRAEVLAERSPYAHSLDSLAIKSRLRDAGWVFHAVYSDTPPRGPSWVIDGKNGENCIRVEDATAIVAWRKVAMAARELGMGGRLSGE